VICVITSAKVFSVQVSGVSTASGRRCGQDKEAWSKGQGAWRRGRRSVFSPAAGGRLIEKELSERPVNSRSRDLGVFWTPMIGTFF
jgi:hypothetical protein